MNNIQPTLLLTHDVEKMICEKKYEILICSKKKQIEMSTGHGISLEEVLLQFLFSGYAILSANVREVCAVNNVRKKHLAEKGNC